MKWRTEDFSRLTVFIIPLQAALAVPSIQPFSFEERLAKEKQLEEAGVLKTIGFLESAFLEYIRNDRARFSAIADQFCETNVSREIVRRIRTVPAKGVLVSPCVEDRRAIDDAYFLLDKMAKAGWLCLLASNDVTWRGSKFPSGFAACAANGIAARASD